MSDARTPPPRARAALAVGILAGAWTLFRMATGRPGFLALNLEVYYHAAGAVLAGRVGELYAVAPPAHPAYTFVYPPVVVVGFLPYAAAPSPAVPFLVHTLLQVAAGLALAALLVRVVERAGVALGPVDRVLVAGFVVGSIHTVPSLYYGNVNLALALALAAGLVYADRRPALAGAAVALPAIVKVFPAGVGVWWLRRRAWRPIAAAAGTGLAAVVASVAVFGVRLHERYVRAALLDRLDPSLYAGGIDPNAPYVTLRRPLSVLFPAAPRWALAAGAGLALLPVVAAAYTRLAGRTDRMVAVYVTVAAVLLFFPSYFIYLAFLYYPLVPLLYLLEGTAGRLFAAGTAVAAAAFTLDSALWTVSRLPAPLADPLAAVVTPALTVASLPLYGVAITLLACCYHRYERAETRAADATGAAGPGE